MGLDVQLLRQASCRNLVQLLDELQGKKDLVLDPQLMKPLDRICRVEILKDHGVEKIYKLERTAPPSCTNNQRIYIIFSDLMLGKVVADQVTSEISRRIKNRYLLIVVPRLLASLTYLFEEEGLYKNIVMKEFPWELIPVDENILSLELPKLFPTLFVRDDQSLLPSVARSIWSFQMLYGQIPNVYGHGKYASVVHEMVKVLFERFDKPKVHSGDVTHLFLFDRNVDYVTPLLTPLTYEGLLDETFGIKSGVVDFGSEVTGKEQGPPVKYHLSSRDNIYNEIRHKHFASIFTHLQSKTKWLQKQQGESQKMSVNEIKSFVTEKLKDLQAQSRSLALHIGASEVIIKQKGENFEEQLKTEHDIVEGFGLKEAVSYIEDGMAKQVPMMKVLRLLCLYSHTQDGLSAKEHRFLKTQFLHSYGFEHLVTLHRLEKVGLFNLSASAVAPTALPSKAMESTTETFASRMAQVVSLPRRSCFQTLVRNLHLRPKLEETYLDSSNPKDPGYVFNHAYVPLTCGVVRKVVEKNVQLMVLEDSLRLLPGKTIAEISGRDRGGLAQKVALVYFIGGVTYAEIAAFQLLGSNTGIRFILAGTSIVGGNSLLQGMIMNPTPL